MVVNTTFRAAPWADYLFFHDRSWYDYYKDELSNFEGKMYSQALIDGVEHSSVKSFCNSGATAIALAIKLGFKRVILLGADGGHDGYTTHWHGSHPYKLGDARSHKNWPGHFKQVAKHAKANGVEVLNASRKTKLDCFPRTTL